MIKALNNILFSQIAVIVFIPCISSICIKKILLVWIYTQTLVAYDKHFMLID